MKNGFCQTCRMNVSEDNFSKHADNHFKQAAKVFALTNKPMQGIPVKYSEAMSITELK